MAIGISLAAGPPPARAQQAQNPSPMVEHARVHPRLADTRPPGRREALELGTLPARRVPKSGRTGMVPLLVVFHAGSWLPEFAGHEASTAVIGVQLPAGSAGYAAAVAEAHLLPSKPGPLESRLDPTKLTPWLAFAREALAGRKRLLGAKQLLEVLLDEPVDRRLARTPRHGVRD